MNINELYMKTIFCCMACDGEIAKEETERVSQIAAEQDCFGEMDIMALMNQYVAGINADGVAFLNGYLNELKAADLSDEQQLRIVNYAVQTICADEKIEYSEIKFFKKIRSRLALTDEQILDRHQDIEDWLLPDINVAADPEWSNIVFADIDIEL